ncbi:MAG: DMT family transporter, partial [Actinobacteria bacterium]|nr:DMT family transporter [Actinomycetota bacterium]
ELAGIAGVGIPLFAVQFGALYTAMAEGMPAATVALVACSSPMLVAIGSALLRWERITPIRWLGIVVGVVGVVVTLADRVGRPPSLAALAWTVLGLLGLAVGTLLQSRLRPATGPAATASVELAAAAVVLAGWAPLRGSVGIPLTGHALGSFAWLALVTGVGAPLLLFTLIRQRGAARASSLLFVVPAVTALAGWPLLGTPVGPLTVTGLVISAFGLWLARAPQPGRPPVSRAICALLRLWRATPNTEQSTSDVESSLSGGSSTGAALVHRPPFEPGQVL